MIETTNMTPMQEDAAAMLEHGRHLMTGREMDVCEAVIEGAHVADPEDGFSDLFLDDEKEEVFPASNFSHNTFASLRIQYAAELPKWKEAMR